MAGRIRQRLALILVFLGLVVGPAVAIAVNMLTEDLPAWLEAYRHLAGVVVVIGSLLVAIGGAAAFLGPRSAEPVMSGHERRAMLTRVGNQIQDLLWRPAGDPPPIPLGLTARPDLVVDPRAGFAQHLAALSQPSIKQVLTAADQALLIVGEPGAGKSSLLAELARSLLEDAERDLALPVPVLINLTSFPGSGSLADWLAMEVSTRYRVPRARARAWVDREQLLPLLDGLDEPADPEACVSAIRAFRSKYSLLGLVVCARLVDYEQISARLWLRGAIQLQAPTRQHVSNYLYAAGVPLADVFAALGGDRPKRQQITWALLQSPLTLSVITRTYQQNPAALRSTAGPPLGQRRAALFDAYIEAMLSRQRSRPSRDLQPLGEDAPRDLASPYQPADVVRWLAWLAGSMQRHRLSQFRIESLAPTWLPEPEGIKSYSTEFHERLAALMARVALIAGSIVGLPVGLIVALLVGRAVGLLAGLVVTVVAGLPPFWTLVGLFSAAAAMGGDQGAPLPVKSAIMDPPNKEIHRAGREGLGIAVITGLVAGLFVGGAMGLVVGLFYAVIFGSTFGLAYIRHYWLRAKLVRDGSMPWRYVHFLNHAADRVLLRRVGSTYEFIHPLLQRHFAMMLSDPAEIPSTIGIQPAGP